MVDPSPTPSAAPSDPLLEAPVAMRLVRGNATYQIKRAWPHNDLGPFLVGHIFREDEDMSIVFGFPFPNESGAHKGKCPSLYGDVSSLALIAYVPDDASLSVTESYISLAAALKLVPEYKQSTTDEWNAVDEPETPEGEAPDGETP